MSGSGGVELASSSEKKFHVYLISFFSLLHERALVVVVSSYHANRLIINSLNVYIMRFLLLCLFSYPAHTSPPTMAIFLC